jgi:8-oxo-dGTP pyrophosphatase MutT (NUDIX family)
MSEQPDLKRPALTVASIVERDGRFLLVWERTAGGLRLNQPAGHLEGGESLAAGAVRETLEESRWQVEPVALVGIYRWEAPDDGATFVRFAYAARPLIEVANHPLDPDIVEAVWLGYDEVVAWRAQHRSPLVLRCIDDYRSGQRYPLSMVSDVIGERRA